MMRRNHCFFTFLTWPNMLVIHMHHSRPQTHRLPSLAILKILKDEFLQVFEILWISETSSHCYYCSKFVQLWCMNWTNRSVVWSKPFCIKTCSKIPLLYSAPITVVFPHLWTRMLVQTGLSKEYDGQLNISWFTKVSLPKITGKKLYLGRWSQRCRPCLVTFTSEEQAWCNLQRSYWSFWLGSNTLWSCRSITNQFKMW